MGDNYMKCKESIQLCFQVKNVDIFNEMLSDKKNQELLPYICVAFYQNITLLFKSLKESASQMAELFIPLISKYFILDSSFLINLLENKHKNSLKVDEANWNNWKDIDFNLLLVQIKYTVLYSESNLIVPLKNMLLHSNTIFDIFLPTMPQDSLYEIKTALNVLSEYTRFYGLNFEFYQCID